MAETSRCCPFFPPHTNIKVHFAPKGPIKRYDRIGSKDLRLKIDCKSLPIHCIFIVIHLQFAYICIINWVDQFCLFEKNRPVSLQFQQNVFMKLSVDILSTRWLRRFAMNPVEMCKKSSKLTSVKLRFGRHAKNSASKISIMLDSCPQPNESDIRILFNVGQLSICLVQYF